METPAPRTLWRRRWPRPVHGSRDTRAAGRGFVHSRTASGTRHLLLRLVLSLFFWKGQEPIFRAHRSISDGSPQAQSQGDAAFPAGLRAPPPAGPNSLRNRRTRTASSGACLRVPALRAPAHHQQDIRGGERTRPPAASSPPRGPRARGTTLFEGPWITPCSCGHGRFRGSHWPHTVSTVVRNAPLLAFQT